MQLNRLVPRVLLTLAVATAVPLGAATSAAAHDRLTSSTPGDGATLDVAPDAVELTMSSAALGLGTQVQVSGPDGIVSAGDASVVDTVVRQPLVPDRPAGSYQVQWRVTSADGHPVSGSFTFTTTTATGGTPLVSATAIPSTSPTPSSTAAPGSASPSSSSSAGSPSSSSSAGSPRASTSAAVVDPVSQGTSGSSGTLIAVASAVVVVLAGVGAYVGYRRRRD
ncbi:MAG: copper resistance CopC family protein [Janthinobacterium lividum]